jgi:hypothetical protein
LGGATTLHVAHGSSATGDAALTLGGQITGGVESGASSIAGAEVDVFNAADGFVAATCTGSSGGYTLTVPAGSYEVGFALGLGKASCSASTAGYLPQYWNGASSLSGATAVPVADIEVDALYGNHTVAAATCTAADGSYTLTLAADDYRVGFATGLGAAPCTTPSARYVLQYYLMGTDLGTTSFAGATDLTPTPGTPLSGIDASLTPTGPIAGTVTDAGRCGASAPTGYAAQYHHGEPDLATAGPVSVSSGTDTAGIDAALAHPGQINGTVTDASTGAALAGISVQVLDASGTAVGSAVSTGAGGVYAVSGLAPATYRVEFTDPTGKHVSQFYDARSTLSAADPVTVTSGSTTAAINAALAAVSTGTSTVSTGTPKPRPGALKLVSTSPLALSRADIAHVVLDCVASGPCTGEATFTATEKVKPRRRGAKAKSKVVVLGAAAIAIAGGRTATVKIALNRAARGLLAAAHGKLTVILSLKGLASGTAVSLSEPVRLKC